MDKITNCASRIDNHLIHAALTARIEYLESQNSLLKQQLVITKPLRLANIQHNNKLVSFYTGFSSYEVLLLFYEFLGPAVNICNIGVLSLWQNTTIKTRPTQPVFSYTD